VDGRTHAALSSANAAGQVHRTYEALLPNACNAWFAAPLWWMMYVKLCRRGYPGFIIFEGELVELIAWRVSSHRFHLSTQISTIH
jgi:hypothetical protein